MNKEEPEGFNMNSRRYNLWNRKMFELKITNPKGSISITVGETYVIS